MSDVSRRGASRKTSHKFPRDPTLTQHQQKVFDLARNLYTNIEIAKRLSCTTGSVAQTLCRLRNRGYTIPHSYRNPPRLAARCLVQNTYLSFPVSLRNQLHAIAAERGCTLAALIREFIYDGLDNLEQG